MTGVVSTYSKVRFAIAGLLLLFSANHALAGDEFYDEIKDEQGHVHVHYQDAYRLWSETTPSSRERFLKESREAFRGDNAMDAMPRIISEYEFEHVLKPGVEQRARAIRAFLQDHYSGDRRYLRDGIIPKGIVEKILPRTEEHRYSGLVKPEQIAFIYGPDIMKDADGHYRIIEDNLGFVGGVGDLLIAHELALERYPDLAKKTDYADPMDFYQQLASRFKAEAQAKGGVPIMYMTAPFPDNEDKRIRKLLGDLGIETVTQNSRMQMEVHEDGVYIYDSEKPRSKRKKVGFVIMNGEYSWLDPSHPVNEKIHRIKDVQDLMTAEFSLDKKKKSEKWHEKFREKLKGLLQVDPATGEIDIAKIQRMLDEDGVDGALEREIRDAKKTAKMAAGLTDAILSSKVGTNYSPGVDFVGDKEFYLYVEDLIRYYLKEEPVLRNIDTRRFADGSGKTDAKVFRETFEGLKDFVIKKTDGRGGDAVWIGHKMKAADIAKLKKRIKDDPTAYISQRFTPLSHVNDNIVDLRLLTQVLADDIIVANVPWGRGIPLGGNGKVNLSGDGREFAILVPRKILRSCRALLH